MNSNCLARTVIITASQIGGLKTDSVSRFKYQIKHEYMTTNKIIRCFKLRKNKKNLLCKRKRACTEHRK